MVTHPDIIPIEGESTLWWALWGTFPSITKGIFVWIWQNVVHLILSKIWFFGFKVFIFIKLMLSNIFSKKSNNIKERNHGYIFMYTKLILSFQISIVFSFVNIYIGSPQNTCHIHFANDFFENVNLPHMTRIKKNLVYNMKVIKLFKWFINLV